MWTVLYFHNIQAHMKKSVEKGGHGGWSCDNCGETFQKKYHLERHKERCRKCEHCGDYTTNLTDPTVPS